MSRIIRLQRFLAQAGIASRRKAEELILAGEVRINGQVVRELGTKVDPTRDVVTYQGQRVVGEDRVWLLLNKPLGTVSTANDPEGRQTVLDVVGDQGVRLFPVGRLDYNTEGVLLLTNDGDLAHALAHPSNKIPRTYHVKLRGVVDPDDLERLRQGVTIDGGRTVTAQVAMVGLTEANSWIEMTIAQGINHQIHRMVEAIGYQVLKLIRVSFADLTVEDLRPGRYRTLSQKEVNQLRELVHLPRQQQRQEAVLPGQRRARSHSTRAGAARPAGRGRPEGKAGAGKDRAARPRTAASPAERRGSLRTSGEMPARRDSSRTSGEMPARRSSSRTSGEMPARRSSFQDTERRPRAGAAQRDDKPRRKPATEQRSGRKPAAQRDDKPRRKPATEQRSGRKPAAQRDDKPRRKPATEQRTGSKPVARPAPKGRARK